MPGTNYETACRHIHEYGTVYYHNGETCSPPHTVRKAVSIASIG